MVQLQREVQTPMAQHQSKKQASMVQLQRYLRKVVKVRSSRHGGQSSKSNSIAKIQKRIYVHLVNRLWVTCFFCLLLDSRSNWWYHWVSWIISKLAWFFVLLLRTERLWVPD
jgi:hypothetical protein